MLTAFYLFSFLYLLYVKTSGIKHFYLKRKFVSVAYPYLDDINTVSISFKLNSFLCEIIRVKQKKSLISDKLQFL